MWRDLTSQPLLSDLIRRAVNKGHVHHACLMVGEESETGPLAIGFAQALNCEGKDGDFCGKCDSCLEIANEKHPDIFRVHPESKSRAILINQIRDLEKSIYLKPTRARTRVALIYSADRMGQEAQNAFLKTLEEPPPQTAILLLTEEPQLLLETILSRCLRLPFRPGAKKKNENEKTMEGWLSELNGSSSLPTVLRAYSFAGHMLELLKKIKEEKLDPLKEGLDDPSLSSMEPKQLEKLEEQLQAQAQAEYIHERTALLKTILSWYHEQSKEGIPPRIVEILEKLSTRLNRNINETLAWEVAALHLAENHPACRPQ